MNNPLTTPMNDIRLKVKYSPWVFAFILAILATLKLTYIPSLSWWIVFSPVIATCGLLAIFFLSALMLIIVAFSIIMIEFICTLIFNPRNLK